MDCTLPPTVPTVPPVSVVSSGHGHTTSTRMSISSDMFDGVETEPQVPVHSQGSDMDTSFDAEHVPGVTAPVRSSSSSFAQTPHRASTPTPTPSRTVPRGSFGDVVVHHLSSSPDDLTSAPVVKVPALSGFGPLGTVGEMEAYEAQALAWGAPVQPRRPCAPISASRLVQRRWRAKIAAGLP